jgi:hypothetical protein
MSFSRTRLGPANVPNRFSTSTSSSQRANEVRLYFSGVDGLKAWTVPSLSSRVARFVSG